MIDKEPKNEYDSYNNNQNDYYGNTHKNINGKFEFQFGIIWTTFLAFITLIVIYTIFSGDAGNIFALPFFAFFWYIGISMLKSGYKKMQADIATEDFGEECFGRICKLSSTGSSNGNTYYEATIIAYLPKEGNIKTFKEDIGYNFYEFPEGSYVRLKYFQNDVNIKEIVNENIIPEKTRNRLAIPEKNEGIYNNFNNGGYNNSSNYSVEDEKNLNIGRKILGICLLSFGLMWTSVIALISFVSFITFEGTFLEILYDIIFFGMFWIVGIVIIITGLMFCFKKSKNVDEENNKNYEPKEFENYKNINIEENSDDFDPIQKL